MRDIQTIWWKTSLRVSACENNKSVLMWAVINWKRPLVPDYSFLMDIMFCDFSVETVGVHRQSLAFSQVIWCQEHHHLASLKLCFIDTHTRRGKKPSTDMVLSSFQPPAGVSMQAQIHQPHIQLVQMDHRFANPNSPRAPWWQIYAHAHWIRWPGIFKNYERLSAARWQPTCQKPPPSSQQIQWQPCNLQMRGPTYGATRRTWM